MKAILGVGSRRALLGAVLAITLWLAVVPAVASAAPSETIAGPGSAAGEVSLPAGVAVDGSSGDLYVADRSNFRIDRFDSDGHFLLAWGWGVSDGKSAELQVCGPAVGHPRCFHASSNEATAPGSVAPGAVAVDNDAASPSFHDVYVVDRTFHRLTKFGPSGEFILMAGKGVDQGGGTPSHPGNICTAEYLANGDVCGSGEKSGTGAGEFFGSPTSVTVDAEGYVWVGDSGRIIEFDAAGGFISEAPVPGGGGVVEGLAIDPASGDLYLKSASLAGIRCYALSGAPPAQTLIPDDTVSAATGATQGGRPSETPRKGNVFGTEPTQAQRPRRQPALGPAPPGLPPRHRGGPPPPRSRRGERRD